MNAGPRSEELEKMILNANKKWVADALALASDMEAHPDRYTVDIDRFARRLRQLIAAISCSSMPSGLNVSELEAEIDRLKEESQSRLEACGELVSRLAAAEAEAGPLRRDAERYRFIAADHSLAWEGDLDDAIAAARRPAQ